MELRTMTSSGGPIRLASALKDLEDLGQKLGKYHDLRDAARALGVSLQTVHRWRLDGRLECAKFGGRYKVTGEAIENMIRRDTALAAGKAAAMSGAAGSRSDAERNKAADRAMVELRELGV